MILNLTSMQFDLSQVSSYINQTMGDNTVVPVLTRNELLDGSIATTTKDLSQAVFEVKNKFFLFNFVLVYLSCPEIE